MRMIIFSLCSEIILLLCFPVELRAMTKQAPVDGLHLQIHTDLSEQQKNGSTYEVYSDSTSGQSVSSTVSYDHKNKTTLELIVPNYKIEPLAAGGIALLAGLVTLFIVIGFFIYCNRNTEIVYEPAASVDFENHI